MVGTSIDTEEYSVMTAQFLPVLSQSKGSVKVSLNRCTSSCSPIKARCSHTVMDQMCVGICPCVCLPVDASEPGV